MKTTCIEIDVYSSETTITVGEKYRGSPYLRLTHDTLNGKWGTTNPVRTRVEDATPKTLATMLAEAKAYQEEIGKARDPGEIIRRFLVCAEVDQVEVRRPYGDKYKELPGFGRVSADEWLDNPATFADRLIKLAGDLRLANQEPVQ